MANSDSSFVTPQQTTGPYADLELRLLNAVADFGADELGQMLDAAEAIRRLRRT